MPQVIPYIPQRITVHLGAPSSDAANVTVNFVDYVKNVASSEIYPTWEEAALRANILAIVSFALNRVYTEFYRSRGYNFDITSSTAYDQFFVNGRSYFTNVARLVDELFDDYLRRPGFVEPLAAKFCNGTTVTCEGLSQWGSQNLARQGYDTVRILRSYYGNVEIVNNAPIRGITSFYPGTPLRRGTTGPSVVVVQVELNRISQNYPAIPKIPLVDGIFGAQTEAAVRKFQEIVNLAVDGVVGRETWYALVRYYVAVTSLAELRSQGQRFYTISWATSNPIEQGDRGREGGASAIHAQRAFRLHPGNSTRHHRRNLRLRHPQRRHRRPAPVRPAGDRHRKFRYMERNLRPVLRHRNHRLARPGELSPTPPPSSAGRRPEPGTPNPPP